MFQYFLAVLLLFLAIVYKWSSKEKIKNLPPGPGLPSLIRNAILLANFPYLQFMEWAKTYGPIMRVKFGREEIIVLSDPEVINELLEDPGTAGRRSDNPFLFEISHGFYGVIASDGEVWEFQRKFLVKALREYGVGRSSIETKIMTEVNTTIDWFRQNAGKPIPGNNLFEKFIVNILWNITTSERCDIATAEKDPTSPAYNMKEFTLSLQQSTENGLILFPFLRHFFPELMGWNRWVKANAELTKVYNRTIAEHKATFNSSDLRDVVDHMIKEMHDAKSPKDSYYGEEGDKHARAILFDLLVAGGATVAVSLSWFLLCISRNPQYQKKVHQEIDEVLGSQVPTLDDKARMPRTEALINEVFRYSSVIPLGFPRRALVDVNYKGYLIPKNTGILANLYAVHFSPKVWGDPENFRPERFLSEDGTQVVQNIGLMPFSEGKRRCIGDKVAREELFLYVTSILQAFEVLPEKGTEIPGGRYFESFKGDLVRSPKPFKIIFKPR